MVHGSDSPESGIARGRAVLPRALRSRRASPQRRAILEQVGIPFEVRVSGVEEETHGDPVAVAEENARRKALAVPSGSRSAPTRWWPSTATSSASRATRARRAIRRAPGRAHPRGGQGDRRRPSRRTRPHRDRDHEGPLPPRRPPARWTGTSARASGGAAPAATPSRAPAPSSSRASTATTSTSSALPLATADHLPELVPVGRGAAAGGSGEPARGRAPVARRRVRRSGGIAQEP